MTGTLHKGQYTFLIISRSIRPGMRNVSGKSCRENQNTHLIFNKVFFKACLYEIMWKNIVEPGRLRMTVWWTRIACCILRSTDTLRICNTYCFFTATIFARTHISVSLYLHCLPFYFMQLSVRGAMKHD